MTHIRATLDKAIGLCSHIKARTDGLAPSADAACIMGMLTELHADLVLMREQVAGSRQRTMDHWKDRARCQGYKNQKARTMEVEFFVGALTARMEALGEDADVGWTLAIISGRPVVEP